VRSRLPTRKQNLPLLDEDTGRNDDGTHDRAVY
jgi:hypothetical protein